MLCEKKRVLLLVWDASKYFFNYVDIDSIDVFGIIRKTNSLTKKKILCFFHNLFSKINHKFPGLMLKTPVINILYKIFLNNFYNNWFKRIDLYEKIIVFDSTLMTDNDVLLNIDHYSKTSEKILCFWNKINDGTYHYFFPLIKNSNFKLFSFDKVDCEVYSLNYCSSVYYGNIILPTKTDSFSLFFCGVDKGRLELIKKIGECFYELGLKSKIVLFDSNISIRGIETRKTYMCYDEYLQNVSNSEALLDIVAEGQIGFTMRVMESIYFNKKLITSNRQILESNFYNKNNIFFIEDFNSINTENLKVFLNKEFIPYSNEIKEYYDLKEWVKRLREEK